MKKSFKSLLTHWKTTTTAIIIGVLTFMLWDKDITVEQWVLGIGTVGTVIGLLAKDWDKTDQP